MKLNMRAPFDGALRRGYAMPALAATATAGAVFAGPAVAATTAQSPGAVALAPAAGQAPPELHISVPRRTLIGSDVSLRGRDSSGVAGRALVVQVRGREGWRTVARPHTRPGGRFAVSWRPAGLGDYYVRVRANDPSASVSSSAARGRVTVFRTVTASWYGPGFYGGPLACGGTLQPGELGVANKTLPCGTPVTLSYHGRTVTVPVVDRGPYVAGREYDLTGATKDRLGFVDGTDTLWSSR